MTARVLCGCLLGIVCGAASGPSALRVSSNGRFLVDAGGHPVFLNADTGWTAAVKLTREEVEAYFSRRRQQGFNAIAVWLHVPGVANRYGYAAFRERDGRPDPSLPLVTPGSDPNDPAAYDYWDHVDFMLDALKRHGLYGIVLPTFGHAVIGKWNGDPTKEVIFDAANAHVYGQWLGARYRRHPHLVWMLGGDRSAIYGDRDYRPVFRAMAAGIAGGGRTGHAGLLLSYHPRKDAPQSSAWFHGDPWLSFNSNQHWPEAQMASLLHDWSLTPPKPVWLFEGRYEAYEVPNRYPPGSWGEWQVRYQAYQTVFSGGFGHTYGHERVIGFAATWRRDLEAAGALQMKHLHRLMTMWGKKQYLSRVPDQELIAGDPGKAERLRSERITATRGSAGDYAMFYSAAGRPIVVRMGRLAGARMDAYWFNPRTGGWHSGGGESDAARPFARRQASGPGAADATFNPPGGAKDGNDWVLVLTAQAGIVGRKSPAYFR